MLILYLFYISFKQLPSQKLSLWYEEPQYYYWYKRPLPLTVAVAELWAGEEWMEEPIHSIGFLYRLRGYFLDKLLTRTMIGFLRDYITGRFNELFTNTWLLFGEQISTICSKGMLITRFEHSQHCDQDNSLDNLWDIERDFSCFVSFNYGAHLIRIQKKTLCYCGGAGDRN